MFLILISFRSQPLRSRDPPTLVGRVIPFRSQPLRSRYPPTLVGRVRGSEEAIRFVNYLMEHEHDKR